MLFFDFLYYHLYKLYASYNKKSGESSAAAIIGGFQAMNVLTIILLFQAIVDPRGSLNKLIAIVIAIIFQAYTYIRYQNRKNHSVDVIKNKCLEITESSRKQKVTYFSLYVA